MRQESFPCDGSTLALPAVEAPRWIVDGRSAPSTCPNRPQARKRRSHQGALFWDGKTPPPPERITALVVHAPTRKRMRRADTGRLHKKGRRNICPHRHDAVFFRKKTEKRKVAERAGHETKGKKRCLPMSQMHLQTNKQMPRNPERERINMHIVPYAVPPNNVRQKRQQE